MKREIKFRVWDQHDGKFFEPIYDASNGKLCELLISPDGCLLRRGLTTFEHDSCFPDRYILMQFTGLHDKTGKEIFEGDVIRWRKPYRTTQTHTGDNIPNGSYTEPMESAIETNESEVLFEDGQFITEFESRMNGDVKMPLSWSIKEWTLEDVEDAIAWNKPGAFVFDDPEEGDLQYLIEENKLKDSDDLLRYISGVEVIGNIYENRELIK